MSKTLGFWVLLTCQMVWGGKFMLAVLPDTQVAVNSRPAMFTSQLEWIAANRAASNIAFVLHVGDIVDWDPPGHRMWITASNGFRILDDAGITYALTLGNHDTAAVKTNGGSAAPGDTHANVRITTNFNAFFPIPRLVAQGGRYQPDRSDNAWYTFDAGGVHWLVVALEFCARQGPVDWAGTVLANHTNFNAIILTHYHLDGNGAIASRNAGYGDLSPQQIFDQLIKQHANVRLVLSGHVTSSAWRDDPGVHGNRIYQLLQNYQNADAGGGYLRLLDIDTDAGVIAARMYSPYYQATKEDASRFALTNVSFVTDGAPPLPPSGLSATAISASQIRLTWTDRTGNETGFELERKQGQDGTFFRVGRARENTTVFQDGGVNPKTLYYYRVRATNSLGVSSFSNEAGATTTDGEVRVPNNGFEAPATSAYIYNPNGGSWTFSGNSGVAANHSGFTSANPVAPEGMQVAFLQKTGSVSQTVSGFIPGIPYTLACSAAQRRFGTTGQTWSMAAGGAVIGSFSGTTPATNYEKFSAVFTATAPEQNLSFLGTDLAGGDNTVFIDDVRVAPVAGPLPFPWASANIGSVGAGGWAGHADGVFSVAGGGDGMNSSEDGFHYVSRVVSGDCDVRARVVSLYEPSALVQAGLMLRESMEPGSKGALISVTPGGGVQFIRRDSPDGLPAANKIPGLAPPYWLRLLRSGETVVALYSVNGTTWRVGGNAQVPMAPTIYAGLAVSGNTEGTPLAASFDNVSVPSFHPAISGSASVTGFHITAPAVSGQMCVLETSTNLATWASASTNIAATGTGTVFAAGFSAGPIRFYRVRY